jgi:hypothetical protein
MAQGFGLSSTFAPLICLMLLDDPSVGNVRPDTPSRLAVSCWGSGYLRASSSGRGRPGIPKGRVSRVPDHEHLATASFRHAPVPPSPALRPIGRHVLEGQPALSALLGPQVAFPGRLEARRPSFSNPIAMWHRAVSLKSYSRSAREVLRATITSASYSACQVLHKFREKPFLRPVLQSAWRNRLIIPGRAHRGLPSKCRFPPNQFSPQVAW